MRGYFIDATRTILKGEGIHAVSVRNVAQIAGYSYATLYNYFKDIKELVFECVCGFQDECKDFVEKQTGNEEPGLRRIRGIAISYMKYFVEYPGIFELFYIENHSTNSPKHNSDELINNFLERLCEDDWNHLILQGMISIDKKEELVRQLKYLTVGMMVFYLHKREKMEYQEFFNSAHRQISALFAETI